MSIFEANAQQTDRVALCSVTPFKSMGGIKWFDFMPCQSKRQWVAV